MLNKNSLRAIIAGAAIIGVISFGATMHYKTNSNMNVHNKILLSNSGQWINNSGTWEYQNSNGNLDTGWQQIGGNWYYFNSSGIMQTGWQEVSGYWYYFNNSGQMQTGWLNHNGNWYYLDNQGGMDTGWQSIESTWYHFANSGAMQTGWQQINGKWYYFNSSGAMQTGWETLNGQTYYLSSSGAMDTGYNYIDGQYYYFNNSGYEISSMTVNNINQNTSNLPSFPSQETINGISPANSVVVNSGIQNLSNSIVSGYNTNYSKAEAMYVWVAENIKYNSNDGSGVQYPSIFAYNNRQGVCFEFASLYAALCQAQNIPVRVIIGQSNGVGHAWNQIYANGQWINVDTTYASGAFAPNMTNVNLLSSQQKWDLVTQTGSISNNYNGYQYTYPSEDYFNGLNFWNNRSAQYCLYQYN
ncbi:MAG: transglutaminase domain-containing protein [Sarcina sp.]